MWSPAGGRSVQLSRPRRSFGVCDRRVDVVTAICWMWLQTASCTVHIIAYWYANSHLKQYYNSKKATESKTVRNTCRLNYSKTGTNGTLMSMSINGVSQKKTRRIWGAVVSSDMVQCSQYLANTVSTLWKMVSMLSLIHIWRCRRIERCRSRWSPYH